MTEMSEPAAMPPASTAKPDVLAELGQQTLLLPRLLGAGLEANEHAKHPLSRLQGARH
jgi:hypothetical protein